MDDDAAPAAPITVTPTTRRTPCSAWSRRSARTIDAATRRTGTTTATAGTCSACGAAGGVCRAGVPVTRSPKNPDTSRGSRAASPASQSARTPGSRRTHAKSGPSGRASTKSASIPARLACPWTAMPSGTPGCSAKIRSAKRSRRASTRQTRSAPPERGSKITTRARRARRIAAAASSQSSFVKKSVDNAQHAHAKGPSTKVAPNAMCSVQIMKTTPRLAHVRKNGESRRNGMAASKALVARVAKRTTKSGTWSRTRPMIGVASRVR